MPNSLAQEEFPRVVKERACLLTQGKKKSEFSLNVAFEVAIITRILRIYTA